MVAVFCDLTKYCIDTQKIHLLYSKKRAKGVKMSVASILKGHELMKNLSVEEVDRISRFSERREFDKNDVIFRFGQKAESVYLLMQGTVFLRLPAAPEEFRIAVAKIEKGDLFGLSPLLGSEHYTTEAQCGEDVEVLVIEARKLRGLLQADSVIGFYVMSEVAAAYFNRYIELLKRFQGIVTQIPLNTSA